MKYGCQCECGLTITRRKRTRGQYANAKVEHATTCRKMWDWLKRSGKLLQIERPA